MRYELAAATLGGVFAVCILLMGGARTAHSADTDWPMFRHDSRLTGRSPAKGNMRNPAVLDKIDIRTYEGLAVIRPGTGSCAFSIDPKVEIDADYLTKNRDAWAQRTTNKGLTPPGPETHNLRYADVLPDVLGLEKIEFDCAFSGQHEQVGRLYAFDQPDGKPRLVWMTEPEKDMYMPTILVTDADADGAPEIVVATHYRVMVYDSRTGVKKTELRWHGMRNYGFFGCFTVPGDPYPKFVVIADFVSHIDALDNNGKDLRVLWRKDIEPTIIRKEKITRPGPNPIADIDGDGRAEIVLNLYNDTGDRKWHVIAFDALTGSVRFDLPASYMRGLADVDADGTPELFLQGTRGLAVPNYAPLRLVSLKEGKQTVLWSHKRGGWQTTDVARFPLTANTAAAGGRRTVLTGDGTNGKEFYVAADGTRPSVLVIGRDRAGGWGTRAKMTGPAGSEPEVKGVRRNGYVRQMLISWRSDGRGEQSFETENAAGQVVSWRSVAGPTPVPIVARLRPTEAPTLIAQNGLEQIVAYQRSGDGWRERWRHTGRGMCMAAPAFEGITVADVDGDGEMEVLFARSSPAGEAELVAVDPDGRAKWKHTFKGFDGPPPMSNMGGLTYWTVGRFTAQDHLDVFVNLRRSTMHSDEGFCLCGKNGRQHWRQDAVWLPEDRKPENSRGYAGSRTAAVDLDGDGLDELVCAYPDRYWYASGRTGEAKVVVSTAMGVFPEMWVAYAIPIVGVFRAEGHPQVFWGGCRYLTALLGVDGKPIWYGKYEDGPRALQSLGNVDGSGRLLIGGAAYPDGFRCYDPLTGEVLWTYELPAGATGGVTIAADVDGDGIDEFVVAQGPKLYALNGKDGKPSVVWTLDLPAIPGPLAFGDANGDGLPEVVFGGSDGSIYLVGEATSGGE